MFGVVNTVAVIVIVYTRVLGVQYTDTQSEAQCVLGLFGALLPLACGAGGLTSISNYD